MDPQMQRHVMSTIASIPISAGVRMFKQPQYRHWYAFISGLLLVGVASGVQAWHLLPPILYTYMVMYAAPKHCGALAWLGVAPYLLCWHINRVWFLDSGHPCSAAIAPLMNVAYKLISIANCYQDHNTKEPKGLTPYRAAHVVTQLPSPVEYLSYLFGMGSLLMGPIYEYSTFKELMELKGVWSAEAAAANKPTRFVWNGLKQWLIILPSALVWFKFKPDSDIYFFFLPEWSMYPIYRKLLSLIGIMFTALLVLPATWVVADTACTMSGLNLIGWDEQTGEPKWGRCASVRWLDIYIFDSVRKLPSVWNMPISAFLKNYVYARLPLMWWQKRPSDIQLCITLLVSGLWHGVEAGYLHLFSGFILMGQMDTVLYKLETRFAPRASKRLPWRIFRAMYIRALLIYWAVPYLMMEWQYINIIWSQVYYFVHIVALVTNVVGMLVLRITQPEHMPKVPGDQQGIKLE